MTLKPEDGTSRSIRTDLIDISFIGIGVYAEEKIEVGTDVSIELISRFWGEPIIGKGKIRYTREVKKHERNVFRIGVEFTDINKEAVRSIMNRIQADICAEAKKGQVKRYPR